MSWLVDSCVLIDIIDGDSFFSQASASILDEYADSGLEISPVTAIELAPAFLGEADREDIFLRDHGVSISDRWDDTARRAAQAAWSRHIAAKLRGLAPKRPIADVLIGALALRHDGLITRNPADFKALFPSLRIETP